MDGALHLGLHHVSNLSALSNNKLEQLEDPLGWKTKFARQSEKGRIEVADQICVYMRASTRPKLEIDIDISEQRTA